MTPVRQPMPAVIATGSTAQRLEDLERIGWAIAIDADTLMTALEADGRWSGEQIADAVENYGSWWHAQVSSAVEVGVAFHMARTAS